jgi:iron(III) transport system ATP-binding protein
VATGPGGVRLGALDLTVRDGALQAGQRVRLAMRPEEVRTRGLVEGQTNVFRARVGELAFLGAFCRARLEPTAAPGSAIIADFSANAMRDLGIRAGEERLIGLSVDTLRVFPASDSTR